MEAGGRHWQQHFFAKPWDHREAHILWIDVDGDTHDIAYLFQFRPGVDPKKIGKGFVLGLFADGVDIKTNGMTTLNISQFNKNILMIV